MAIFIVLLGPPGVGKGTQAKILAQAKNLAHISSGDLFRENIKNQTELVKHAKLFIDKGELVPDDVTIDMIRERLSRPDCKPGAILDGFPRTPVQADALEKMLAEFNGQVNVVPYITAPEPIVVGRISGRTGHADQMVIFSIKCLIRQKQMVFATSIVLNCINAKMTKSKL